MRLFDEQASRGILTTFIGLILFIAIGFYAEQSNLFSNLKKVVRSQSVPSGILSYGSLGRIVKQLGVVQAIPNDFSVFKPSVDNTALMNEGYIQNKRYVGDYLFQSKIGGAKDMPSSLAVRKEFFKDGWPLLSVVVDKDDLFSPERGIIARYRKRGREWERLAYVSYYENGDLLFASGAGLRVHGFRGIRHRASITSFRLYFRNDYGASQFMPDILFDQKTRPLKQIVLYRDRPEHFFSSILAFEVVNRIGAIRPEIKPVIFYRNGVLQGAYYLQERLYKEQWVSRLGHNNFAFIKYKGTSDREDLKLYEKLETWAKDFEGNMTMEETEKYVDIDNLSRHIISIIFCGTSDWRQGAAVLDKQISRGKWFWINWDMDQSFWDYYSRFWEEKKRDEWEQEGLELLMSGKYFIIPYSKVIPIDRRDIRAVLFIRLSKECPKYRKYFVRLVMDQLNHRINADFLNSRISHYMRLAFTYGLKNQALIQSLIKRKRFFQKRAHFVRDQIQRYFGTGESLFCEVKGPTGIEYKIDGYSEKDSYHGWYFKDERITIEITGQHKSSFLYWLVNGKKIATPFLDYPVSLKTTIVPVLKESS
ncbi:CotH kinase family protein [Acidobacteriota bacterium]